MLKVDPKDRPFIDSVIDESKRVSNAVDYVV